MKNVPDVLAHRDELVARLARAGRWYTIANQTGDVAEIRIYDEIWVGGLTAKDFAADLERITAPEIIVAINSPGGDVFDSIAIYNALRNHPATITTRVDGVAASAASLIVQAGERRIMMPASQMMIHEAWGIAVGPSSEIRDFAELLERQTDVIANIYAERSGKPADHFRELMAGGGDTWFTAEEAIGEGLADELAQPEAKPKNSRKKPVKPRNSETEKSEKKDDEPVPPVKSQESPTRNPSEEWQVRVQYIPLLDKAKGSVR